MKNRIIHFGVLIIISILTLLSSCYKEVLNEQEQDKTSLIDRARNYYENISQFSPGLLSIDTGDIFAYLDLDWNYSKIEFSNTGIPHVKVPVIIDAGPFKDSISADYIFYDDTCGLTSEIWFYGYDNTYLCTRKDSIIDGWVIVMNSCYWTSQVFVIANGTIILRDTIDIVPDDDHIGTNGLNSVDFRKYKPKKIKCPTFDGNGGGGVFGGIGKFFSNIGDFFGKIFKGGKGKKGGAGGNGGNGGNGGEGGDGGIGGWSGHGGWGLSSGGYGWGGYIGTTWIDQAPVDYKRYSSTNKIFDCLGSSDGTFASIKQILSNTIGHCKTLPTGAIDALAGLLMRQDQGTWKLAIKAFLENNNFSEHCLKTIFDTEGCTNNAPNEFASVVNNFISTYGNFGLDEDELITLLMSDCKDLSGEALEECMFLNVYNSIPKENFDFQYQAFEQRILRCESFDFRNQVNGNGQYACVQKIYLSRTFPPAPKTYTSEFCISVQVPSITWDNRIFSKGDAQNCAAWAANKAAFAVGLLQQKSLFKIPDIIYIKMFKVTFLGFLQTTDCAYDNERHNPGQVSLTDCSQQSCLSYSDAIWQSGSSETWSENDYGCH